MHNFNSLSNRVKIILGIISLSLIFGGITFLYARRITSPVEAPVNENLNFGETGYIQDRQSEKFNEGLYLVYEKPGAPALSVRLSFDEKSMCTFGSQTIICMALNVTIDTATAGKRAFVTGIRQGDTLRVRNIKIVQETTEEFGIIKSVKKNGENILLQIDEVEFLSGDKAKEAVMKDFDCPEEKVSECVPSMNNDFYIRNLYKKTFTYNLTPETSIKIFQSPGSPVLLPVDIDTFAKRAEDKSSLIISASPFMFRRDGETITVLEQQYTP